MTVIKENVKLWGLFAGFFGEKLTKKRRPKADFYSDPQGKVHRIVKGHYERLIEPGLRKAWAEDARNEGPNYPGKMWYHSKSYEKLRQEGYRKDEIYGNDGQWYGYSKGPRKSG
jgi:hypothetical protein